MGPERPSLLRYLLEWLARRRLWPAARLTAFESLRRRHRTDAGLRDRFPSAFDLPGDTERLLAWVRGGGASALGLDSRWLARLASEMGEGPPSRGARVVGLVRAECGMGELVRSTYRSLASVGYPVTAFALSGAPHREQDLSVPLEAGPPSATTATIIHANACELLDVCLRPRPWRRGRALVAYVTWEQEQAPPEWPAAFARFDLLDEVWATSRYAAAALAPASPVPRARDVADRVPLLQRRGRGGRLGER